MGRGASISATSTMHAQPTVIFEWLLPLVKEKAKSTSLKSETLHGYQNVLELAFLPCVLRACAHGLDIKEL